MYEHGVKDNKGFQSETQSLKPAPLALALGQEVSLAAQTDAF